MVRRYGKANAIAPMLPFVEGACKYWHLRDRFRRSRIYSPKLPSRKPTDMRRSSAPVLEVSIAKAEGAADEWVHVSQIMDAIRLSPPRVDQALRPEMESAVMIIPS